MRERPPESAEHGTPAPDWERLTRLTEDMLLPVFMKTTGRQDLRVTVCVPGNKRDTYNVAVTSSDLLDEQGIEARQYEVLPWTASLRKNMPDIFANERMRRPILYAGVHLRDAQSLYLSAITVDRDERGRGLGSRFLGMLRQWAAEQGIRRITGEHQSEAASAYFVSHGWRLLQELIPDERFRHGVSGNALKTVSFLRAEDEERAVLPRWKSAANDERVLLSRHAFVIREWLYLANEFTHGTNEGELLRIWPSVAYLNERLPAGLRCDGMDLASHESRLAAFRSLLARMDLAEDQSFGHLDIADARVANEMLMAILSEETDGDGSGEEPA